MAERVILTAAQWEKRLTRLEKMNEKERREFKAKHREHLSLDALRSECMAVVHNEVGNSLAAYKKVEARGGATVQTLRRYANERVWSPRLETVQATLFAVGYELGPRARVRRTK